MVITLAYLIVERAVTLVVRYVDRTVLGSDDTPGFLAHSSPGYRKAGGIVNDDNAIDRRGLLSVFADDAWACLTDVERCKVI